MPRAHTLHRVLTSLGGDRMPHRSGIAKPKRAVHRPQRPQKTTERRVLTKTSFTSRLSAPDNLSWETDASVSRPVRLGKVTAAHCQLEQLLGKTSQRLLICIKVRQSTAKLGTDRVS